MTKATDKGPRQSSVLYMAGQAGNSHQPRLQAMAGCYKLSLSWVHEVWLLLTQTA